jgi:hypothetical protein
VILDVPVSLDRSLAETLGDKELGVVCATQAVDGYQDVFARVRADVGPEDLQLFGDWVVTALRQLEDTRNPHENGWARNPDIPGQWYMVGAVSELPPLT